MSLSPNLVPLNVAVFVTLRKALTWTSWGTTVFFTTVCFPTNTSFLFSSLSYSSKDNVPSNTSLSEDIPYCVLGVVSPLRLTSLLFFVNVTV